MNNSCKSKKPDITCLGIPALEPDDCVNHVATAAYSHELDEKRRCTCSIYKYNVDKKGYVYRVLIDICIKKAKHCVNEKEYRAPTLSLKVRYSKLICKICGKTIPVKLDFVTPGSKFTDRFLRYACTLAISSSFDTASKILNGECSGKTINRALDSLVEEIERPSIYGIKKELHYFAEKEMALFTIGIAERAFDALICFRADLKKTKGERIPVLLEVAERGSSTSAIENVLRRVEYRKCVKKLWLDVGSPYCELIKTFFPNAKIQFDRDRLIKATRAVRDDRVPWEWIKSGVTTPLSEDSSFPRNTAKDDLTKWIVEANNNTPLSTIDIQRCAVNLRERVAAGAQQSIDGHFDESKAIADYIKDKGTICGMSAEWREDISLFGAQVYHTGGCSADLVRKRILYYENVISAYKKCIGKANRLTQRENRYNKVMAMHFAALIDDWAKATNIKVFNDSSNLHVYDHIFTVWSQNEDNPHGGEEGTVFFTGIALRDITKLLIKVRQDREAYRKGNGKHGRSDANK